MECYCYLRNIQDLLSDGKTPHERRFGMPFDEPVIPFGAMVEYHLVSSKDLSRLHQIGPKVLPGIFLGYVLSAGGIWKGDIMVADIEELEQMDASELHCAKGSMQRMCQRQKKGYNFCYSQSQMEQSNFLEEIKDLRTSTLILDRRDRGEEQGNLQGESDELHSPTPLQDDSTLDDAEVKNDFWTITGEFIYRHHVAHRVKLYVPKEESFPIPLT